MSATQAVTRRLTVLAMRLEDPANLFTLRRGIAFPEQILLMSEIALAHAGVIDLVFQEAQAEGKVISRLLSVDAAAIDAAASHADDDVSMGQAAARLRQLCSYWLVAAFETEEDALCVAVAIQERTRQSRTNADPARLQCAIAVSHEDPPRGIARRIRGVAGMSDAPSLPNMDFELGGIPVGPEGASQEATALRELTDQATGLLADRAVAGGRLVCSRQVHDSLRKSFVYPLYAWQPIANDQPMQPRRYAIEQLRRLWRAIRRGVEGEAEPWECLYTDAQSLLDSPFERVFSAEIAKWVRPRRLGPEPTPSTAFDADSENIGNAPLVDDRIPFPERPHPDNDLVGLALSGGGMRSGIFSLGVVQALAHHGLLDKVDYISSVSGGAYVGASLSSLWAETLDYDGLTQLDASVEHFPYASRPGRHVGSGSSPVHGNESPALQHVRANANLLGRGLGLFDAYSWSWAGQFLTSIVMLWVFFLLPAATLLGLAAIGLRNFMSSGAGSGGSSLAISPIDVWTESWFPYAVAELFAAALLILSVASITSRGAKARTGFRYAAAAGGVITALIQIAAVRSDIRNIPERTVRIVASRLSVVLSKLNAFWSRAASVGSNLGAATWSKFVDLIEFISGLSPIGIRSILRPASSVRAASIAFDWTSATALSAAALEILAATLLVVAPRTRLSRRRRIRGAAVLSAIFGIVVGSFAVYDPTWPSSMFHFFASHWPGEWDQRFAVAAVALAPIPLLLFFAAATAPQTSIRRGYLRSAGYWTSVLAATVGVTGAFGSFTIVEHPEAPWSERGVIIAGTSPLMLFCTAAILSTLAAAAPWRPIKDTLADVPKISSLVALALTPILLLSTGVWAFERVVEMSGEQAGIAAGSTGVLSASIAGISLKQLWDDQIKDSGTVRTWIWKAALAIGGYIALGLAFTAWFWLLWTLSGTAYLFVIGGTVSTILVLANTYHPFGRGVLNQFSLNRAYSSRIQATWVIGAKPPGTDATPANSLTRPTALGPWTKVWLRDDMTLSKLAESSPTVPYHLICTTLNLPGSTSAKLLDRKSDSFIIAPIYSGSALTRWIITKDHLPLSSMPLAEAAAISGAAVSPNMGNQTSRTRSIITTLFNVRMGRWLLNPRPSQKTVFTKFFNDMPVVLYWKEMLGLASHEDGQIYLSDGGHFDNLGLFELIRRRCKYIVAVSADVGSIDEAFDMGNLGDALRLARVEFGVEADMGSLKPVMHDKETGCVQSFFAAGTLTYPSTGADTPASEKGILIFIKTGIVEEKLTADLVKFWQRPHSAFPYDPTTDQQYDQPSFEAYRQLGYLSASEMWDAGNPRDGEVDEGWATRLARVARAYQDIATDLGETPVKHRDLIAPTP